MNGNTGYARSGGYCNNGHIFSFAGTLPEGKIPEGFPCSCGMFVAHWVKCPSCGQEKLELIEKK